MTTETLRTTVAARRTGVVTWARVRPLVIHVVLAASALVMLYPVIWMVVSSLRPGNEIFRDPGILVKDLRIDNYRVGWNALTEPFTRYLLNSAVVVLGSIFGNLVSCSMAAYAFARLEFVGKKFWFAIMLLSIMLPIHVVIVPQYIRGIPRELDEAARIDGCGRGSIFLRVILPLMVPALATTTIFTFIWTWNDFFSQLIYLTDPHMYTVPVALRGFVDSTSSSSWGSMFAMSVVSLVPVFLAFLFGQRFLIKGIATTGIK
jgi:multiple sugar transport system permease protein